MWTPDPYEMEEEILIPSHQHTVGEQGRYPPSPYMVPNPYSAPQAPIYAQQNAYKTGNTKVKVVKTTGF